MSSNLLYLSHAKVRDTTLIPLDELVARFRDVSRQFPTPERRRGLDELREHARDTLKAMPTSRNDMYWHGQNKQACPCSSCCASAYRLLQPHIEEYFQFKHVKPRRFAA